jgi:flavin-dependent dehydrogenase
MFDVIVVGGGPAGATAAEDLAREGRRVALLDRAGRIKPCGGAIPPRAIRDFHIPEDMLVAKITTARMISPTGRRSTSRSRTASSAWSTASISTSSCAPARPRPAPNG